MKRIIVLIGALALVFCAKAQNYIVYTLFEPDTCFTIQSPDDTIHWDLNRDGNEDIYFYLVWHGAGGYMTYMEPVAHWRWSNSIKITPTNSQPLTDTTMIDETLYWEAGYSFLNLYYDIPEWWHYAFRHQAEDGIHYGWVQIKCTGYRQFCISGMGYCKLANQPIRWGQTELLGISEAESNVFTSFYPNPTKGIITVKGENLQQAEVLNMLGQRIFSVQGKGNELHIDMAALPAGVYFVSITNEEGRKCVRKVVKEW